jgi:hypothetical protein
LLYFVTKLSVSLCVFRALQQHRSMFDCLSLLLLRKVESVLRVNALQKNDFSFNQSSVNVKYRTGNPAGGPAKI